MTDETRSTDEALKLSYHVVLVTDILGQRARLRDLKALPVSEPEKAAAIEILRDTSAYLMHWRDGFRGHFNGWEEPHETRYPAEAQEFIERATAPNPIRLRSLSDTITVASSLYDDGRQTCNPVMGVMRILLAAAGMHLLALSVGRPTRGGIDVGVAMTLPPDDDIYGPALERAVFLEAEVAEYPRIAVGQELLQYLQAMVDGAGSKVILTPFDSLMQETARSCQRLIFRDEDGTPAVDFLGAEVLRHYGYADPALLAEVIPKAFRFVNQAWQQWRIVGNEKLAERYGHLWTYFRSRAAIWGPETQRLVEQLEAR